MQPSTRVHLFLTQVQCPYKGSYSTYSFCPIFTCTIYFTIPLSFGPLCPYFTFMSFFLAE